MDGGFLSEYEKFCYLKFKRQWVFFQKLFFVSAIILAFTTLTFAQEAADSTAVKPSFSLSGSADVYFRANLSAKNNSQLSAPAPATSFANLPGFSLGMFNLIGSYKSKNVGVVGDLVFGPRGADAVFYSEPALNLVNQLYVYWDVNDKLTLTFGNFNTFLGYEVISPVVNFNYSTSYMFSWGPFSHSGLKANFALSDDASLMLGVFNATDYTDFNPINTYTLGAQFGYKGLYLNLLYGDQDGALDEDASEDGAVSAGALFQADLTAGFDLTDALFLGLNATVNTTAPGEVVKGASISDAEGDAYGFYGAAAYLQYRTSESFALGVRGEYFGETNSGYGILGAYNDDGAANVLAVTLSANINIGNLTLIPEIRLDNVSEEVFENRSLEVSKSLSSFLLAAVYSF
ncbi:MAG: porin [Saprospiraceae bacterium]|nr:porin [Saprospiraceae bacterium]